MSLKLLLLVLGFLVYSPRSNLGESSTCLTVYKEGGAPAVFQSPKCPRWKIPNHDSGERSPTTATGRCQSAVLQGRRKHMEDRTVCMLDLHIPFPSKIGVKEVSVGVVAVFDGHNGAEASEMASKLLLEYFALHTYFLLDATFSFVLKKQSSRLPNVGEGDIVFQVLNWDKEIGKHGLNFERFKFSIPENLDDSFHLGILKEALLRAIHDIDATFSKEASRNNLASGSTATIILIADGQILVANIGDSKAILCSEKFHSPSEARETLLQLYRERRRNGAVSPFRSSNFKVAASSGLVRYIVKELTRDHHPDRDDERSRVEAAGGYVVEWGGVSRVNGQLAISRSIGDLCLGLALLHVRACKERSPTQYPLPWQLVYGVIAAPEVTDWQSLTANDSYLVVGSDGIFEKLSLQDVCDLLWEVKNHDTVGSRLSSSCSLSLADCLVNTAFERGSMDNMAAIVVPLGSAFLSQNLLAERCGRKGAKEFPANRLQKFIHGRSDDISPDLLQLESTHPITTKFNRLLVQGKPSSYSCFYLSENLNDDVDDTIQTQKEDYVHDQPQALPNAFERPCGGPLNVYNDRSLCLNFGMTVDGANDQCVNPEGFASFLGLLESIPFHDTSSSYGTEEYPMPDSSDASRWGEENKTTDFGDIHFDTYGSSSRCNTSRNDSHVGSDGNLFILKRIMVERGASVYLSGLREKYFGEVFLNASRNLGSFPSGEVSEPSLEESQSGYGDTLDANLELGITLSPENIYLNKSGFHGAASEEGLNHIARYVESFESRSNEIWLVFHYEGMSLSKLMYTMEEAVHNAAEESVEEVKQVRVLRPSKWWHWLRTTEEGQEEMRDLIWQLISALTRTLLDHHIEGWNEDLKELAYKLRSFMELCILITGSSSKHHHAMNQAGMSPASWKCSEEFFSRQIRSRDPLKLGFPNVWALRLVRDLLRWDPMKAETIMASAKVMTARYAYYLVKENGQNSQKPAVISQI
ncbi:hypothetical protein GOBAR_AA31603 [Gossypium barbadense]|uniref:PPM-type phosphatase domain-containing protein n=1 Tax=Gossypium barbadense TaxID=3634 RepID=A0A2P5WDF3_GOSBA|nr:hypothetical protein GOBAR_AA31603 [Gossypium barbadense]